MAIVVTTLVPRASRAEADRFDESVWCNDWRAEADVQSFYDDVMRPKLADAGLTAEESTISPVWVYARP